MSQIIVTSRYLKSGSKRAKTKRRNYTKYIATRESVEKREQNISVKNVPVTDNQNQLINDLITEFPLAKKYLEYEDYTVKPSAENASELISAIIERNADVLGNRKNFVGYMALRPGAERRGEHGLFTDGNAPIDLNAVANEVANHPGNVWSHVISLRREDAVRLGYINSDMWRELVKRHISDIANAQNIPLANLKWYAAFHDTTHHPHIHLLVYSKNPKQGYLTNEGIKKIRSAFSNDIFHDDLKSVYQQQTLTRDELKILSENQMQEIVSQIGNGDVDENLIAVIKKLHTQLQNAKGKKVYGYLPKEVKQTVDEIFFMLAQNENVAKLYEKWCEFERTKYKMYTQKETEFPPLADNSQFKSVKNMIIKTVLEMDTPILIEKENSPPEPMESDSDDEIPPIDYDDNLLPDDFTDAVEVDLSDFILPSKFTLKWSDDYKSACKILYDKNSDTKDYLKAEQLLLSEESKGNALAMFELGKLYSTDKLGEKDEEKSAKFYAEALAAFIEIEPNADFMFPYEPKYPGQQMKPKDMRSYVWYRISKMYCYGLGTEQDYAQAFKWFEKAAVMGNKFAQFSLANLYYYGNGVEQSYEKAFDWYSRSAKQGQPYAAYAIAQMFSKGEYVEKDESQTQSYYKQALAKFLKLETDDQADDNLFYKIGRMFKLGFGTDSNVSKAIEYFKRAADLGNKNAMRSMALEYISGENVEQDVDKGIEMLTELADNGDTMSVYKLGKIYLNGDAVFKDLDKAEKYLRQAADDNNEYAVYALAKLYLTDEKYNLAKAVKLLEKACEHEHIKPYAAYTYSKILLDDNEFHDSAKAVKMLEENTDNNWCSYLLGKLYLFGNDEIEKDKEKAVEWLTESADNGNEYAENLLKNIEDFEQSMFTNAVMNLFVNLSRIIEDNYSRNQRNLQSKADQKLRQMIWRKKEEIGIKSDSTMHFNQ